MHGNGSTVLASYDPATLKKYLSRVNMHIDWYNDQSEKKKSKIFSIVSDDANLEMVRRFENFYDVKIIGIAECGQSLHLTLYNRSLGQILADGTKIKNSQTSTTVQNLGISIAELVLNRAKEDEFKPYISQQMINVAARTKYTLEKKMVA